MSPIAAVPDDTGHFGPYGGRFVPETLIYACDQLAAEYARARSEPAFQAELDATLRDFAGRPSALFEAERFSEAAGCRVFLKREDLLHTGAHKINNTVGQCLLTRRMGKPRVIAETTGQPPPEGTHTAEFLLAHGMIDQIVDRSQLRGTLATLIELRESFDLDEIDTLAAGDGANDLGMIQAAGLGVAYHAKPAVAAAAAARIDYGDLTALLYAQGYRRDEFAD